jgi:hypothetical protein
MSFSGETTDCIVCKSDVTKCVPEFPEPTSNSQTAAISKHVDKSISPESVRRGILQKLLFTKKRTETHFSPPHKRVISAALKSAKLLQTRRDGRVAEGARLESVFRGNSNVGSNPTLSAMFSTTWLSCDRSAIH